MVHGRARLVAGLIARERRDRRGNGLVVAQREERDADGRIGEPDRRPRIRRILRVPNPDARLHVRRRGPEHDELGAAEVDEVVDRDDGHARRVEAHLQVPGDRRGCRPQPKEHRARRGDDEAGGSVDQFGLRSLAERNGDLLLLLSGSDRDAAGVQRCALAVLLDGGGERLSAGHRACRSVNVSSPFWPTNFSGEVIVTCGPGSRPARNQPIPPPTPASTISRINARTRKRMRRS